MLWSLLKIVIFVGLVAALTYGAGWLMESGPGVLLVVGDFEFNLGPLQAAIFALVLFAAIWLILRLAGLLVATVRFFNGDDTAITRYLDRSRQRRGYDALGEALMSLSAGEPKQAMAKAAKAEKYLQRPELTAVVTAQAAELIGDKQRAEETYKKLLKSDKTRFVGIRGLMNQKLASGDDATALALAEKAFALKPKNEEVQTKLLQLQADKGDFSGARRTLGAALKSGTIPRDIHRRRDAVLALSEAKGVFAEGKDIEARMEAIEANRLSPDLVPAAVMAARSYISQGKGKNAARVLKKAWESQPHPDLATTFAEIEPNESPAARVKRFEFLTKVSPTHPETKMLLAELLIAAEDFPAARRALGDLTDTDPTKRNLTLMAAIERGLGADDAVIRGWLAKAVTASPGPQWVCEVTGKAYPEWQPMTEGGFDTLTWKTVPASEAAADNTVGMLPLLVGDAKPMDPGPAAEPEEPEADIVVPASKVNGASTADASPR